MVTQIAMTVPRCHIQAQQERDTALQTCTFQGMPESVRTEAPDALSPVSVLRVVRAVRGLSQSQLAGRCEPPLARLTISRLENHHEEPQRSTAQRLAAALDFPVSELFPELNEKGVSRPRQATHP